MDARLTFKEGWIMLLRPFEFAELSKPLQKLTILYAFSEKPIIKMELSDEGQKKLDKFKHESNLFSKSLFEEQDRYEERKLNEIAHIFSLHRTVEVYEGEIIQCYVENQMCRFYPDEYNVISKETFDHVLTAEDYDMEVESRTYFDRKDVASRVHYVRSRGIDKPLAERMASAEAKDSVIFRPRIELLEYFCREHEIY